MVKNALNRQQMTFLKCYLKSGEVTNSAIQAGYSKKTAHAIGSRLLKHRLIIRELEIKKENIQKSTGLTLIEMVKEIKQCKYLAEEAKQYTVVATCNQQLAKISGLLIDKQLTATTTPEDLRLELSKHFKIDVI